MSAHGDELNARRDIAKIVLRRLGSEMEDPSADFDAELEYCDDMLVGAARRLVDAVARVKAEES